MFFIRSVLLNCLWGHRLLTHILHATRGCLRQSPNRLTFVRNYARADTPVDRSHAFTVGVSLGMSFVSAFSRPYGVAFAICGPSQRCRQLSLTTQMKNKHNTLRKAAAAATATLRDLTTKVKKTLSHRPQNESGFAGLFITPPHRRKSGFRRQDMNGKLQITCPCCQETSLHWIKAGHDKLPDGTPYVDISTEAITPEYLNNMAYQRFNKGGAMKQASAAEANKQDELDNRNVPVTSEEMKSKKQHHAYDPTKVVDVEDRTLVNGLPNPQEQS